MNIRSKLPDPLFLLPDPLFLKMACRITTREDLFELFREKFVIKTSPHFIKSVSVNSNNEFREAIAVCLQELLGIRRMENLSPLEVVKFEEEVTEWYKHVPRHWKKSNVAKHYSNFKKHHGDFLSREIYLGENNEVPNFSEVFLINFNHLQSTYWGNVSGSKAVVE